MNITIQQLIEAIALKFNMQPCYDLAYRVALQVMMLPENHFTQLFAQLAYELNIERSALQNYFLQNISTTQNLNTSIICNANQTIRFKGISTRKKSETYLKLQLRFESGLRQALHFYCSNSQINGSGNAQLCQITNNLLRTCNNTEFWKHVQSLIPEKNERQLRDYYQKSFMRQMYEECISGQDKILLCQLIDQMPGAKPAQIVEKYTQMTGCVKYFKRNLVMYVINRKEK
ncbi:Hypothetical_protein [Hexamita inflata]|uniref:Hypothetical_protein n=1 Tax=Hexamita inflata TaxID=28002 RepID=A0AA86Q0J7_9EUKA|nr:Hypothetical protein HINF_LOCUS37460 [Hexamita inflata]